MRCPWFAERRRKQVQAKAEQIELEAGEIPAKEQDGMYGGDED